VGLTKLKCLRFVLHVIMMIGFLTEQIMERLAGSVRIFLLMIISSVLLFGKDHLDNI